MLQNFLYYNFFNVHLAIFRRLLSSGFNWVGAPAVGLGLMEGHMTYSKVCAFLQGSGEQWDKASRVPYAWRSREWLSYENEASVKEKVIMSLNRGLPQEEEIRDASAVTNPLEKVLVYIFSLQ